MNDFDVSCATSIESMRCSSLTVPSVTDTRACVCPRVNSADPWVRGSTPTSQLMGHRVQVAPVDALAARQDLLAHRGVRDLLEDRADVLRVVRELGAELLLHGRLEGRERL